MPAKPEKFEVKIDKHKCKGCGLCIMHCPRKCLQFSEKFNRRGRKYAVKNKEKKCIGCGACFLVCPDACIAVYEKK